MEKESFSVREWLKETQDEGTACKPCTIIPLAGYYREILEEGGFKEEAESITAMADDDSITPDRFAETLDSIKTKVCSIDSKVCERLQEADKIMLKAFEEVKDISLNETLEKGGEEDGEGENKGQED